MTVNDILSRLDEWYPLSLQLDFDNAGLLVGDRTAQVRRCLIALDITDEVIDEAIAYGAQLIVSHHPLIFTAQKTVLSDDLVGGKITKLVKNDIAAVCMHTNLDIADGGVNDALIRALGCEPTDSVDEYGCGRIGEYAQPLPFDDFLVKCKTALSANGLRYVSSGRPVKRLAVLGGAGGGCVKDAAAKGCDTYVTSDIKYNAFLDAKELGINLIDADHFCTENVVVPVLYERLKSEFPDVEFKISETHKQIICFA